MLATVAVSTDMAVLSNLEITRKCYWGGMASGGSSPCGPTPGRHSAAGYGPMRRTACGCALCATLHLLHLLELLHDLHLTLHLGLAPEIDQFDLESQVGVRRDRAGALGP